jgi:hypothetical protein
MRTPSRRHVRLALAVVLVVSAGAILSSYARAHTVDPVGDTDDPPDENVSIPTDTGVPQGSTPAPTESDPLATTIDADRLDDAGNFTVVATQGFFVSDEQAELVAFDRNGEIVYYDDSYRVYFDVDPVPGTRATVEYLTSTDREGEECPETPRCTYNSLRRVNLSTGDDREVYGEVTPRIDSTRWHDADRINETHIVIADIYEDSVRIVNVSANETAWRWHASETYDRSQGGQEGDWTHVNDVEVLQDGRIMASIRNMDQVVFIELGDGVQESWTLGEDDNYSILYEQHNPDYIPASRGGPAITVADSENNRVLEYQRVDPETGEPTTAADGEWRRSWGWRDSRVQWPRDVDRLPGDTSLVVDTHGDRVAEVAPNGSIVWSVTVGMPYDAERLGTGDESAGGRSMRAIRGPADDGGGRFGGLGRDPAVTHPERGIDATLWAAIKDVTPSLVVNGVLFAGPSWLRFPDLVFGLVALLTALTWGGLEGYWRGIGPQAVLRSLRDHAPGR